MYFTILIPNLVLDKLLIYIVELQGSNLKFMLEITISYDLAMK